MLEQTYTNELVGFGMLGIGYERYNNFFYSCDIKYMVYKNITIGFPIVSFKTILRSTFTFIRF